MKTKISKVIQFPHNKMATFSMPLDKLDSFEGRKKIALLLRQWERSAKANTFKLFAAKANLHPRTIANIASETTVYPRLHTILAIMGGLGFTAVRFE